jgi:hypothetical protein
VYNYMLMAFRVIVHLLIKETQCELLHLRCQWERF